MNRACTHPENLNLRPEQRDHSLAGFAKGLAHPVRVRLLRCLAENDECIGGELVASLGLAQSTVSEHLRILREAGLVKAEPRPPRTCYRLAPGTIEQLRDLLQELSG